MAQWRHQARRVAWRNGDEQPKPTIRRFSRESSFSLIVETLEEDGCIIIKDFISPNQLDKANQDIAQHLLQTTANEADLRILPTSLKYSPTLREIFAGNLNQALMSHFLSLETTHYEDRQQVMTTTQPLLSAARSVLLSPGNPQQPLIRPDAVHRARHQHAEHYELNRDVCLGLFLPGTDADIGRGSIRVVPGSHLWGDGVPDLDGRVLDVDMDRGEALLVLGSVYLGFSAYEQQNSSSKRSTNPHGGVHEKTRDVVWHTLFSCNGATKPEELGALAYSRDEIKSWPKLLQDQV